MPKQVPLQQGIASLQALPTCPQVSTAHVPDVVPSGMLQTPPQQSMSPVHADPSPTQAFAHVFVAGSQLPEQHWPFAAQERAFGTQATHFRPVPASLQRLLQQLASVAHVAPVTPHPPVSRPHLKPPAPSELQVFGAQQERSSAPLQAWSFGVQVEMFALQCSTPFTSGTQGAPPQHWPLNWQTFTVVRLAGSAVAMQHAGLFAS